MTDTVVQLTANDFDEGMAFLNMVFGEHSPHDFAAMLPSIYRATDQHMAANNAVCVDGEIRGIVGLFPMVWKVGDTALRVGGIGGVSTHPEARGKGYMRTLMNYSVKQMRERGYELSWLGGQRQRYQYFGYEKCGNSYHFTLNRSNLRHSFSAPASIRFEPLAEDQAERLERAIALHDAQPAHAARAPGDFARYLVSWYHRPWAAVNSDGEMVGYLVADKSGDQVAELAGIDDATVLEMVRAWTADHCEGAATFEIHPWSVGQARLLSRHCESMGIRATGNWQVLNWVATLDALLKLAHRGTHLAAGEVVVQIEGAATVRLSVGAGGAGCEAAEGAPADLVCDTHTAMRALFGPLPTSSVCDLPAGARILESWCPLPLSWSRQDGV